MRFQILGLVVGVAIASATVLEAAVPSGAQVAIVASACTATTATFVQAAGSPRAPVLVPMNVPVTVCTLSHNVRVILPAFQVVGTPASIIVPSGLPMVSCAVSSGVAPNSTTLGVQAVTISGSVVTLLSPATVVAPLITCS